MPEFDDDFAAYAVAAAREYCRVTGYKISTVGMRSVGDAAFFTKLADGNYGASLARFKKAVQYLIRNWPEGAVRPARPPWPFIWPTGETNGTPTRVEEQKHQAKGKRRHKARREENGRFSRV